MRKLAAGLVYAMALLSSAPALSAEPVKIRLAWVVPVSNWATMLAEKMDLARNNGKTYSFEPVRFQGTPPMITALAAGELEIALLAYPTVGIAIENAGMKDIRVIADEIQDGAPGHYSHEFMVRKDSPVKAVTDLKGKTIATNAAGSAVDIALRAMLKKNKLDDKRDVTVIETAFPNMKAMLAEKKVEIVPGVLPFSLDPGLRDIGRTLFTQRDAMGTTELGFWAARTGFIQKNRAALVDFTEDAMRIIRWYLAPANHKAAVAIAAKVTKQPEANFDGWLFTDKDYYRDLNMMPNLNALNANLKLTRDLGFLKTSIDIKQYADLSIVQEAAKRQK
jgi:NitT/TauT family transport system substrate-binding protein